MKQPISILKALSDKNRLRIIFSLLEYNELCACQITELLQVKGATASRHLSQLSSADLIESRKQGRWVYYFINSDFFESKNRDLFNWVKKQTLNSKEFKKDKLKLEEIMKEDPEIICKRQRNKILILS